MFGNVQAVQQNRGIDFRGIAAFVADDAFELAEAHAVFVRQAVGILGVEDVALLQRLPQSNISHDYGINDAMLVKSELVLSQDADFLRSGYRTFLRIDF